MTTVTKTVRVCDMCAFSEQQSTSPVKTHVLTIDGHTVELEACDSCWRQDFVAPTALLIRRARVLGRKKQAAREVETVQFPGQAWRFTFHALFRMGERHLAPCDVVGVAENPQTWYPGNQAGTEVRVRDEVKVVVDPARRAILTCANRDEEMESVA